MRIKEEVRESIEELIRIRRDLHKHPELGFQEYRTSDIIFKYLQSCGIEVKKVAKTGVAGLLKGNKPGRTLLLRADMDALPITEENDIPYKSTVNGRMHACGHDGHVAMLLVAAKILAKHREEIQGNIKFVFQPNEEDEGASFMVAEGVMDNPKVDGALAIHLMPALPSGTIDIIGGPVLAASHYFYLTVKGRGGHAGLTYKAVDPIITAAEIIQSVQSIQTREINALDPTAIVFTKIHAGENTTIVPEKVEMEGSIRFLYRGGESCLEHFRRVVGHICRAHMADFELKFKTGNHMVVNDIDMAELVRKKAIQVVGSPAKVTSSMRAMYGDDFAEFAAKAPGAYYQLGIGNAEKKTDMPLHHPCFNVDEEALPVGVEMHVGTALDFLAQRTSGKAGL